MIKFAKYRKSTWCRECSNIYRQHGWDTHKKRPQNLRFSTGARWGEQSLENWHCVSPRGKLLLQKRKHTFNFWSSRENDIYFGLLRRCWSIRNKALWNSADISQWPLNLICRGGKQRERRWPGAGGKRDIQQGSWAWKTWGSWLPAASGSTVDKERAQHFFFFFLFDCKQWGDLNLLTTAMATDFESQPSCGFNGFWKRSQTQPQS